MLRKFISAAQTEVDNHSIYVWGGSGQLCRDVTEAWIRAKERGRQPDAALREWEEVESGPYRDVARCFDCSGYVSWCLIKCGAAERRRDCDGLFARCEEIYTPTDGTLLFRVNPANKNDETHVGIYYQGKQYHAKGRAYGVVCEPFKASYWQKYGWYKALKPDVDPEPEPTGAKVEVIGKSVYVRDSDSRKGRALFVAHRGDTFPLICTAPSGWYAIETKKGPGYITNLPRYTKVTQ